MKQPVYFFITIFVAVINLSCNSQAKNDDQKLPANTTATIIGGSCESCELMYIDMPGNIPAIDTSAGWNENGQKLLVKGTVYKQDGKAPATGVIIYYWQTDNNGLYSPAPGLDEKARRHGHIRGWMRTGTDGTYALYTIRPAPYPNSDNPSHIHIAVKEPAITNEYYIDEVLFDDDKLLTAAFKNRIGNRGGNGIVKVTVQDSLQLAQRDIILGLNIPGYPKE